MSPEAAARLAELQIQLMAEARDYRLFARGNCVAFEHSGNLGSTGMMTENGLAYVVWREGRAMLVSKGGEAPAEEAQLAAMRAFSQDLKDALGLT